MKEAEKKGAVGIRPSEQVLRYLYICALDGKAPVDEKVNRYFIDKLSGEGKELTIYEKALELSSCSKPVRWQKPGCLCSH